MEELGSFSSKALNGGFADPGAGGTAPPKAVPAPNPVPEVPAVAAPKPVPPAAPPPNMLVP